MRHKCAAAFSFSKIQAQNRCKKSNNTQTIGAHIRGWGVKLVPISHREAFSFIDEHHRHHRPPQGLKFAIGLADESGLIGVVCVGRPVSRNLDDGLTAEVTRLCTLGHKNACSKLYSAAWRTAKAMGYRRIITYTLETEPGTSLKAAGWRFVRKAGGGSWSRPSRKRNDKAPIVKKQLWEMITPSTSEV